MNSLRPPLIFAAGLIFTACAANPAPEPTPATTVPVVETSSGTKPTLVVMVLVDQLRADLLDKYGDLFTGGFKRIREQGHSYTNATHEHAVTETAVGHATLSTGVYPDKHGVVSNQWFELQDGQWVLRSNVSDPGVKIVGQPNLPGVSPRNLMRSGLAEWIIKADPKSIIASVSGKDRGAIQPASHAKSGYVYWFDVTAGRFVTSTYYRNSDPGWVTAFNDKLQQRYRSDTLWASRIPSSMIARSNKDSLPSEGDGVHTAFPHTFGNEGSPNAFWAWWSSTPDLDAATIEMAETMVTSLGLGKDNSPDFLNVSASATDRVGHAFGPNSREQLDNLLRLDKELGAFFDFLDRTVGRNKWTVMLTADHGVLDSPEDLQARGEYGHRLTMAERKTLDSLRLDADQANDPRAAAVKLRDALKKLPIIGDAWTHEQLDHGQPADSFEVLQRNSRWPGREEGIFSREGVEIRFIPGILLGARGSSHGTPYFYDRHVPMIFMGPGIPAGRDPSHAATVDFAPTVARILGIPMPTDLDGHPLTAVSN
jgi:predicted AlkP superfamily pyrophosphatase or phosphodiesterase